MVGLAKGSLAASDGLVHVGDIITHVNGISSRGVRALLAMGISTSYVITLLREKGRPTNPTANKEAKLTSDDAEDEIVFTSSYVDCQPESRSDVEASEPLADLASEIASPSAAASHDQASQMNPAMLWMLKQEDEDTGAIVVDSPAQPAMAGPLPSPAQSKMATPSGTRRTPLPSPAQSKMAAPPGTRRTPLPSPAQSKMAAPPGIRRTPLPSPAQSPMAEPTSMYMRPKQLAPVPSGLPPDRSPGLDTSPSQSTPTPLKIPVSNVQLVAQRDTAEAEAAAARIRELEARVRDLEAVVPHSDEATDYTQPSKKSMLLEAPAAAAAPAYATASAAGAAPAASAAPAVEQVADSAEQVAGAGEAGAGVAGAGLASAGLAGAEAPSAPPAAQSVAQALLDDASSSSSENEFEDANSVSGELSDPAEQDPAGVHMLAAIGDTVPPPTASLLQSETSVATANSAAAATNDSDATCNTPEGNREEARKLSFVSGVQSSSGDKVAEASAGQLQLKRARWDKADDKDMRV